MKDYIHQTSLSLIYLMGDFIFAVISFCTILTLLVAGFGLSICWIGLPIVILLFNLVKYYTQKEIEFVDRFLPVDIRKPSFGSYSSGGLVTRFKMYIKDRELWRYIGFHLVKLPITMVTLVISVFMVAFPLKLLFAPFLYLVIPYRVIIFRISNLFQAVQAAIVGAVLGIIFSYLLNKVAIKQGLFLEKYL